jgi:hypothetical protein
MHFEFEGPSAQGSTIEGVGHTLLVQNDGLLAALFIAALMLLWHVAVSVAQVAGSLV